MKRWLILGCMLCGLSRILAAQAPSCPAGYSAWLYSKDSSGGQHIVGCINPTTGAAWYFGDLTDSTIAAGHCVQADANNKFSDAGGPCALSGSSSPVGGGSGGLGGGGNNSSLIGGNYFTSGTADNTAHTLMIQQASGAILAPGAFNNSYLAPLNQTYNSASSFGIASLDGALDYSYNGEPGSNGHATLCLGVNCHQYSSAGGSGGYIYAWITTALFRDTDGSLYIIAIGEDGFSTYYVIGFNVTAGFPACGTVLWPSGATLSCTSPTANEMNVTGGSSTEIYLNNVILSGGSYYLFLTHNPATQGGDAIDIYSASSILGSYSSYQAGWNAPGFTLPINFVSLQIFPLPSGLWEMMAENNGGQGQYAISKTTNPLGAYNAASTVASGYDVEVAIASSGTAANTGAQAPSLAGTSAGTFYVVEPRTDGAFKQAQLYLNGYENTTATAQAFNFPVAFTAVNGIVTASGSCSGITISLTTITLPASMGAAQTGLCEIYGY